MMKINFLTFITICILSFIYLYFSEYYFNFCIGDSFYVVNYFYVVLLLIIVTIAFYLVRISIRKLKNKQVN